MIRRLFERLPLVRITGFYTQEIRIGGVRAGFELISLDGRRSILAHIEGEGNVR